MNCLSFISTILVKPLFCFLGGPASARWDGRISLLSTRENNRQNITTNPMAWVIVLGSPVIKSIGRNAMTVVKTPKVAGTATFRVPAIILSTV